MKNVVFIITILGSIILLIAGKMHWDEKVEESGMAVNEKVNTVSTVKEEVIKPLSDDEITELMGNFSESTINKMISSSEPLSVIIVGSESIGNDSESLETVLQKGLNNTYWENAFSVEQIMFSDKTTTSIVEEELYEKVIENKPDIVIMESFTLNDNGVVVIDQSHKNLNVIKEEIEENLSGVSYILMPSNPIHDPNYYSVQIKALNEYAEKSDVSYLNYWDEWPEVNDDEIKNYLEKARPSNEGIELWGNNIVDYMSGE